MCSGCLPLAEGDRGKNWEHLLSGLGYGLLGGWSYSGSGGRDVCSLGDGEICNKGGTVTRCSPQEEELGCFTAQYAFPFSEAKL